MYLPLFPLSTVVYPGEALNLHIFEPRYRQLIAECVADDRPFGIPPYVNDRLPGYGTEMIVTDVVSRHADGTLDIRTLGRSIFRILDFENPAPGKLYAHAKVEYGPEPEEKPDVSAELLAAVDKFYRLLDQPVKFDPQRSQCYSYQIAHGIGLSLEEEYQVLRLETEDKRQAYLLEHLHRIIPLTQNLERTKDRIRMKVIFAVSAP